ncbi:putative mating channel protein [Staphylococcus aureus]|nr:putative mating channel protein [Staphylococcus aureus]
MILMFKNDKYKMRHRINKVDQSGNRNQPITRNSQSKDRLKEQKDINKHGK